MISKKSLSSTVGGIFDIAHPSSAPVRSGLEATAGEEPPVSDGGSLNQDMDLPLIFEPLDGPLDGIITTGTPSIMQSPPTVLASLESSEVMTPDLDPSYSSSSKTVSPTVPEGPFVPWQMSGTEISDIVSPSVLSPLTAPPPGPPLEYDSVGEEMRLIPAHSYVLLYLMMHMIHIFSFPLYFYRTGHDYRSFFR